MSENAATDVVVRSVFTDEDYLAMRSPEDAFKLAVTKGFAPGGAIQVSKDVLGNGFEVLPTKEKDRLVGVRLLILSWQYNEGEQGEFVSANVMTADGKRYVLNDGSTGILAQLHRLEAWRRGEAPGLPDAVYRTNLMCENGLRKSEYDKEVNGKMTRATTYYIA